MVLLLLVPEPGDGGQQLGVRLLVSPSQLPDLVVVVLSDRLLVTRYFISIRYNVSARKCSTNTQLAATTAFF